MCFMCAPNRVFLLTSHFHLFIYFDKDLSFSVLKSKEQDNHDDGHCT